MPVCQAGVQKWAKIILEEIDMNGYTELFIDFSNEDYDRTLLVWDNGDYIV